MLMLTLGDYCFQPDYRVLSSIRREFGQQWKHVGYKLGLECTQLEAIELNKVLIEERAFTMLCDWIHRDVSTCYCKLISAMKKEHLSNGVEHLKEEIKLCK